MANANLENGWSSMEEEPQEEEDEDIDVESQEEEEGGGHIPQNILLRLQDNAEATETNTGERLDQSQPSTSHRNVYETDSASPAYPRNGITYPFLNHRPPRLLLSTVIDHTRAVGSESSSMHFIQNQIQSHQNHRVVVTPTKRILIPQPAERGDGSQINLENANVDFPVAQKFPRFYEPKQIPEVQMVSQRTGADSANNTAIKSNKSSEQTDRMNDSEMYKNTASSSTHMEDQQKKQMEDYPEILSEENCIDVGDGITVQLLQNDLWNQFHKFGTEMIITKNGRRMFPVVKVRIKGLQPNDHYFVYLDIESVDTKRYRYVYPSSQWMVAGTGEPLGDHQSYVHPDSPAKGDYWMSSPVIAFDKLKLTNNRSKPTMGQICLHSMQKYCPEVCIQRVVEDQADGQFIIDKNNAYKATFPETTFITVTAYQNQQITKLKIDSNPFAKGFRDGSKKDLEIEKGSSDIGNSHLYEPSRISSLYPHHIRPQNIFPHFLPVVPPPSIPIPHSSYNHMNPIISRPNLNLIEYPWFSAGHRPFWRPLFTADVNSSSSSSSFESVSPSTYVSQTQDYTEQISKNIPLDLSKNKNST